MRGVIFSLIVFIVFLVFGIATLGDYGISWDSPVHFRRGQTYLHYFLTGRLEFNKDEQKSFYQVNDVLHTGKNLKELDMGHPPLGDILSAASNYIFHQKLGILGDIEAYNLFIVFAGALTVALVFLFAYETIGVWAGIFSSVLLSTYPLFWSESHFNIKDIPETAFITATIYFFHKAFTGKAPKFLFLSAVAAGIAFGIKFNIVFVIPILLFWFIFQFFFNRKAVVGFLKTKKAGILLVLAPLFALGVLYFSWPYLWNDPIGNFVKTLNYYRTEGTNIIYQPQYVWGIFNLFPAVWIALTTNPLMIALFGVGLLAFRKIDKAAKNVFVLWLIWFLAPIARVTFNKFAIYGGVRQIMEFLPAMALIAGAGASYLGSKIKDLRYRTLLLLLTSYILLQPLLRLHPNENVYFNFFAGGLKGAYEKNVPAAGNTFGNAYKYGIKWMNENVPTGAKLALVQGATSNLPLFWLRGDIDYSNAHFSGIEARGEYLMEVIYLSETKDYHYAWEYVDKFLTPVYEEKIDGVSVLKVWKNEVNLSEVKLSGHEVRVEGNSIIFELPKEVSLTRITVNFLDNEVSLNGAFIETSRDGIGWTREKDPLLSQQIGRKSNLEGNTLTYYFAAREAKFARFNFPGKPVPISPKVQIRILSDSNFQPGF